MKTTIYCKPTAKGVHSFYIRHEDGNTYYLFSQKYRKGVAAYFRNGVDLARATDKGRSHGDAALLRTMEKLPVYIRYVEKEQDITVLKRSRR